MFASEEGDVFGEKTRRVTVSDDKCWEPENQAKQVLTSRVTTTSGILRRSAQHCQQAASAQLEVSEFVIC